MPSVAQQLHAPSGRLALSPTNGADERQSNWRPRRGLKILILHANDDLTRVRRTSFNHAFCLLKYAPWNSYELHAFGQPITQRLRHERFDAVILDTTFLCWRWAAPREQYFDRLLRDYAFVADSDAIKIALPQDEYDHCSLLDEWLTEWQVDVIYSVCWEHRHVFYPKAAGQAEIVPGLTGFIDDADIAMMRRLARPFEARDIDVGYRARDLPPYVGRYGRLKAEIGERFLQASRGTGLRLDISLDTNDSLPGDRWLRFLGNCRFTLGCESGSSLLDPAGEIRRTSAAYLAAHSQASYDEVEAACFPGQDMVRIYSALSPRVFEAALAGTCQILVPGHYLGLLRPDQHYIPLASDGSNLAAVQAELSNWRAAKERAAACRAALLETDRLTYRGFVRELLQRIEQRSAARSAFAPTRLDFAEAPWSGAERIHQLAEATVGVALRASSDLFEVIAAGKAVRLAGEAPKNSGLEYLIRSIDGTTGFRNRLHVLLRVCAHLAGVRAWQSKMGRRHCGVGYRSARRAWHALPPTLRHAILRRINH